MKRANLLVACGLFVGLSAATTASADVTVLGLRSLDGDEALAENLTRYVRTFIASRAIGTVSSQTQTLEQMILISDCPEDVDARCLREMADALGAEEIIYGFLTRMPGEDETRYTYTVDIRRYVAAHPRDEKKAQVNFESNRQGTANLQILVNALLDTLYDRQAGTSLIVQSNEPGATVLVDGRSVGRTGAEPLWITDVAPGSHLVRIEKEGFDAWERELDVVAHEYRLLEAPLSETETHVAVTPPPPVGETNPPPTGEGEGEGEGEPEPEQPEGPSYWDDWRTIAGWSTLGGGIVFAGVGLAFTVSIAGINDDSGFAEFRAQTPVGVDACDRADSVGRSDIVDLCDSGSTYTILQFVMYGLAAGAIGTGAYFLIANVLDDESSESEPEAEASADVGVAVSPFGLPGGGGLTLAGWF